MKKTLLASIVLIIIVMMQVNVFAIASFTAVKATPTIDGKMDKDEWDVKTKFTMNKDNGFNWMSGVNDELEGDFYFAWDDDNFYVAAEIKNDLSVKYGPDDDRWTNFGDCIYVVIEPGNTKTAEAHMHWYFIMGAKENGDVIAYRMGYDANVVSTLVNVSGNDVAKASGHIEGSKSYIIEAAIPWSIMKTNGSPDFIISQDVEMPMMIAILDRLDDNGLVAMKSGDFNNKWSPSETGTLKLVGGPEKKSNPKTGFAGVVPFIILGAAAGTVMKKSSKS